MFILAFLLFLVSTPVFANEAADYAHAQKCYHGLDRTSVDGWGLCLHQFRKVADKYPTSVQGTKALYSHAKISEEKFRIFSDGRDLEEALKSYNEFLRKFPKNSMADDALFQIAILRFEKQGDKDKAERALTTLLQRYAEGDKVESARGYLSQLKSVSSSQVPGQRVSVDPVAEPVITAKSEEEGNEIRRESAKRVPPADTEMPSGADFLVKTVVIDPGHGGDDPGAIGQRGLKESVVSLQIARKIAFKLKKDLKIEVYLTRTINRNLSLKERNVFALQKQADLFISLHANANVSKKMGGVQTFYLNNATSEASRRLAARENKMAKKSVDLSEKILSTLLQNANTEESRDLAHAVQGSLVSHMKKIYPRVKDQKVDAALFYVLVGAKCPGILVEASFITNPEEELWLRDSDYQWAIASGVAQGVKKYIESQKKNSSSL